MFCQPLRRLTARLSLRTLRSRHSFFEESDQACIPCGSGPAAAEAARKLVSRVLQMDLMEGIKTGPAFSLPSPAGSSALSLGLEVCTVASSTWGVSLVLQLSSSEEVDVLSIKAGEIEDLPLLSPVYEELVEVVTCAVSKLNSN